MLGGYTPNVHIVKYQQIGRNLYELWQSENLHGLPNLMIMGEWELCIYAPFSLLFPCGCVNIFLCTFGV